MTNANPPNEVYDGKTPGYRNINSPYSNASIEQVTHRQYEETHATKGQQEAGPPEPGTRMFDWNISDLVSYGAVGFVTTKEPKRKTKDKPFVQAAWDDSRFLFRGDGHSYTFGIG